VKSISSPENGTFADQSDIRPPPDQWPPVIVLQPLGFPQGGAEIEGTPGVGVGVLGPVLAAVVRQPIATPLL
jgi:hypothetical protein